MDAKTARKYRRMGHLPSELPVGSRWRTRPAPFAKVWAESNAGLEAKTVFEFLQRRAPNRSGADQRLASSSDGMTGPVRTQRLRLAKETRDISDDILAVHSRIRLAVL